MLRTHTCGQLNKEDINKEVSLCGWVASRRDHGKLIFIDLRDRYGITQIVFNEKENPQAYKIADSLRSEFVILVKGVVSPRPKGTVNPKIATGEVELNVKELQILNSCEELPFEINSRDKISEELRMQYRYLDLRAQDMLNKQIARHTVYQQIRLLLDKQGFLEIETPILTKSTPEGARDFLVPSRLNPGKFYALPQSPQLFKQILMVAGIDKYFQIAKCFRDEDLRSDRQPEFTQLDVEMSFIDEEDIFTISEKLMYNILKTLKGVEIKIPFLRMAYKEAQEKFSTDKPDLRKKTDEFAFLWIVDFPLFKYNKEEKRWESEHHPFTAPHQDDLGLLDKNPEKVRARSYDLVLNGQEIGSGSIRIHTSDVQKRIFEVIGIKREEAEARFGFLLEAFKYGAPPHGGIAFGIDRLLAILTGADTIREVISFAKTQKAVCPLTQAPSYVEEKQLKEVGIKIR